MYTVARDEHGHQRWGVPPPQGYPLASGHVVDALNASSGSIVDTSDAGVRMEAVRKWLGLSASEYYQTLRSCTRGGNSYPPAAEYEQLDYWTRSKLEKAVRGRLEAKAARGLFIEATLDHKAGSLVLRIEDGQPFEAVRGFPANAALRPFVSHDHHAVQALRRVSFDPPWWRNSVEVEERAAAAAKSIGIGRSQRVRRKGCT